MKIERIRISDLKIGDKIKTFNPSNGKDQYESVVDIKESDVPRLAQCLVVFSNGLEIECSINHPFMVMRGDEIIPIKPSALKSGEFVIIDNNKYAMVHKVILNRNNDSRYIDIEVENTHTFYTSNNQQGEMVLTHNSQGGIRGGAATVHYMYWHKEIESLLVLKNNKGVDENRVRQMDYSLQLNELFFKRLLSGGNITLFDPNQVPDLLKAFYSGDNATFERLYIKYEKDKNKNKKTISAIELMELFVDERVSTGRIYCQFIDNVNNQGSFDQEKHPINMSNLCVHGDTKIDLLIGKDLHQIEIKNLGEYLENNDVVCVKSKNLLTNAVEYQPITAFAKTSDSAEVIRLYTKQSKHELICTPQHAIYTKNRGYVCAENIQTKDELDFGYFKHFQNCHMEWLEEKIPVYDITVESNANFYANDILIHNCQEIALPTVPMGQTKTKTIRVKKEDQEMFEKLAFKDDKFKKFRRSNG